MPGSEIEETQKFTTSNRGLRQWCLQLAIQKVPLAEAIPLAEKLMAFIEGGDEEGKPT